MSRVVIAVGMVAVLLVIAGCDSSPSAAAWNKSDVAGMWLEIAARPNVRAAAPRLAPAHLRRLTLDAGGTFTLALVAIDGGAVDESKSAKGTWKVNGEYIEFAVTESTLDDALKGLIPHSSPGKTKQALPDGGTGEAMTVEDTAGGISLFQRS